MDCLIIGDSIAIGTRMFMPQCRVHAKTGINSQQWNKSFRFTNLTANNVIISLGSNDHSGVKTVEELHKLRERVTASRVYWIVPANKPQPVIQVANEYGDVLLPITKLQPDNVHPSWSGYKDIIKRIQ